MRRRNEDGFVLAVGDRVLLITARDIHSTYPEKFHPPCLSDTPESLFGNEHRFIRTTDPYEILIYTGGACARNGQRKHKAGCAFVYRPDAYSKAGKLTHGGTVVIDLETKGPTGSIHKPSSNRTELRAVIAALQFRDWSADCNGSWNRVVMATDSEYVALSITERIEGWEAHGWKIVDGDLRKLGNMKNPDLWRLLLGLIRVLGERGVEVAFW